MNRHAQRITPYLLSILFASTIYGWSPNDIAEPGKSATKPKIVTNAWGKSLAVWQKNEGATIIQAAFFDGFEWQEPVNLSEEGQNALRPDVAINDQGEGIAVWQRFDSHHFVIQASHFKDGQWSAMINLSESGQNAFHPTLCLKNDGQAIALWRRFNGKHFIIQAATYNGLSWSFPANLSEPGYHADSPEIHCEEGGRAIANWQRVEGSSRTPQSAYFNGTSWTKEPEPSMEQAPSEPPPIIHCCETLCKTAVIEARAAYFRPNSSRLRAIYGNAWFDFGMEGSYALRKSILAFLTAEYTFAFGNTLGGNDPTEISLFPLSFGLKAAYRYKCFEPYIGLGPKFFFVWIDNDSLNLMQKENFSTVGGVAKFGTYFFPTSRTALSLFLDYSFAWKKFPCSDICGITRNNLDLSNLLIGASFGASF